MQTIPNSQIRDRHREEISRDRALGSLYTHAYYTHFLDFIEEKEKKYVNQILSTPAEKSHKIARIKGKLKVLREITGKIEEYHRDNKEVN